MQTTVSQTMEETMDEMDELKRQAALSALEEVRAGMILGLGTGSTASHFIRELGIRVREGLQVRGIPTSEESTRLALEVGVALTSFKEHPEIDLTVDGADEVSPGLDLMKGLGGALVREKIVAHRSKRVVIVVDESKLVGRLGEKAPVPVEVVPFAVESITRQLEGWAGEVRLREKGGRPFVSDNGNPILDWRCPPIDDPLALEKQIKGLTGVVDCGIFARVASLTVVAGAGGIRRLTAR